MYSAPRLLAFSRREGRSAHSSCVGWSTRMPSWTSWLMEMLLGSVGCEDSRGETGAMAAGRPSSGRTWSSDSVVSKIRRSACSMRSSSSVPRALYYKNILAAWPFVASLNTTVRLSDLDSDDRLCLFRKVNASSIADKSDPVSPPWTSISAPTICSPSSSPSTSCVPPVSQLPNLLVLLFDFKASMLPAMYKERELASVAIKSMWSEYPATRRPKSESIRARRAWKV